MKHRRLSVAALLLVVAVLPLAGTRAQQPDQALLTLDRLFDSRDFTLERFGPARWLDGSAYTTLEREGAGAEARGIVRHDARTGAPTVLVPASRLVPPGAASPIDVHDYDWSADGRRLLVYTNSRRVWRQNTRGDYWVLDLGSGRLQKLGGDAKASTLMFAKFSPDATRVGYVRENDIYVEDLASGRIDRLTTNGSPTLINGTFDWVYEEELGLQDGFRWSPDGRSIAYWQLDSTGVDVFNLINTTDTLYPELTPIPYPKVGTTNSSARIGIVPAAGGETTWLDIPGDPRNQYLARMEWAAGSDEVIVQRLNRLQNENIVYLGDRRTGAARAIFTDRDAAWVNVVDDLVWFDQGRAFTWVSERDGWRHVYMVAREGGAPRLVTRGDFDVISIQAIDEAGGWVYYIASPENPTERYLYRSRLDGSGRNERLTPMDQAGSHGYTIAPGAAYAFHTWSSFGVPPRTDLVRLPDHRSLRTLAGNDDVRARVAKLATHPVEFFRVDGANGAQLDAYLMRPPGFDASTKYPLLFHVYGEPAGSTVQNSWGGRNYLWHLMLTQQGYLVASVDNQGTNTPRGRAWRKIIYRQIGILASKEQAAAAREIAKRPYVDADRIGVWGWSGGGSMTLNLLFRSPEIYKTGMSVAPVPDQKLYDTIYQERYMGLPDGNAEGYRLGSPITFADQLKGDLLVVHGSGDDNVHYQGTERLVNALVAANRPFQLMVYPNRTHAISEGPGTSRHLYELLTRYLKERLKAS